LPPADFDDYFFQEVPDGGPETLSDKPKPDAAKTSANAADDAAAKYVGTPAVGTSKAVAAAG